LCKLDVTGRVQATALAERAGAEHVLVPGIYEVFAYILSCCLSSAAGALAQYRDLRPHSVIGTQLVHRGPQRVTRIMDRQVQAADPPFGLTPGRTNPGFKVASLLVRIRQAHPIDLGSPPSDV
jgi:hypothetical protein